MDKYNEALNHLKNRLKYCTSSTAIDKPVVELSIGAIKKQIPTKVEEGTEGGFDFYCECGTYLSPTKKKHLNYCSNCGQKLDWD